MTRSRLQLSQLSLLMVSLAMVLLSTVTLAVIAENVAADIRGGNQAEQGMIEDDPVEGMCVTTVTASTTVFTSLMQAVSARTRLLEGVELEKRDDVLVSGQGVTKAQLPKQLVQQNASRAVGSSGDGVEEIHSPCLLHTSLISLYQQGHAIGLSALAALERPRQRLSALASPIRQQVLASTGALVLIFCLLAVLGASAFLAMVSLTQTAEPQLPPELLARANSPYGSRLYLPMSASGPPSLRSSHALPRGSRMSPGPEVGKLSTTSRIPLAKAAQDLASSDDEKAPRRSIASEMHFCPDLVVPQHCECILVLPPDLGNMRTSFTIMDVHGSPVLKAVPEHSADGRPWRALVTTATGESLVTCSETRPNGSEVEFQLMRANGNFFAKLTHNPTQDKYLLTLQGGIVLSIWGNFANSAVNITDEGNRLLATTEIGSADFDPDGTYCRLRVAPLADVGLALCGLLCIGQHLQRRKS